MYLPPTLNLRTRLSNLAGRWLPLRRDDLDPARLMAEARRRTGLEDFGDAAFRPALERLLEACEREAQLSHLGRRFLRWELSVRLQNRLTIHDWLRRRPEILAQPLPAPLFILGLPRTGTTLLQRLLAQDPATRTLRAWELWRPAPPPGETPDSRPRRLRRTQQAYRRMFLSPAGLERLLTMHPHDATSVDEEWPLLQNTFRAWIFGYQHRIPSYRVWLECQDGRIAYRELRRQLQLLTWRHARPRLVLKSPSHLASLAALFAVFPGARAVWLHRPLVPVVTSASLLTFLARRERSDHATPAAVGAEVLAVCKSYVQRALRVRPEHEARVFDIDFRRLVRTPLAVVEELYAWWGTPLSPEARSAMEAWLAREHRPDRGRLRPSPADFGLDPAEIRATFPAYRARFAELYLQPGASVRSSIAHPEAGAGFTRVSHGTR